MARDNADLNTANDAPKPAHKLSPKERKRRELVKELSVVFNELSLDDVRLLAEHNLIEEPGLRAEAIRGFWASKRA